MITECFTLTESKTCVLFHHWSRVASFLLIVSVAVVVVVSKRWRTYLMMSRMGRESGAPFKLGRWASQTTRFLHSACFTFIFLKTASSCASTCSSVGSLSSADKRPTGHRKTIDNRIDWKASRKKNKATRRPSSWRDDFCFQGPPPDGTTSRPRNSTQLGNYSETR